jgi:hypothetical protein
MHLTWRGNSAICENMEKGRIEVIVKFNGETLVSSGFDGEKPETDEDFASLFKEVSDMLISPVIADPELF